MILRRLDKNEFNIARKLFNEVIARSQTFGWSKNWPSDEMICDDIDNKCLFGLFDENKLIAISFAGPRYKNDYVSCWKENLKNPSRLSRICVHPDFQGKGIGFYFTKMLLKHLKKSGFDGTRILVAEENLKAISLYKKLGFTCQGKHFMDNINWLCLELKF